MKVILGSSSKWRQRILEEMGYDFEVMAPNIDEKTIRRDNVNELVLAIASAKTAALVDRITDPAILITSDQVVVCNGEVREKPTSEGQERQYLESYKQYPAETVTGVVVTNTDTGERAEGVDIAKVYFDPIPEEVIKQIIEKGEVFYCCGGFTTDDLLFQPYIKKIEGALDSLIGLPKDLTQQLIEKVMK